MRGGRAPTEPRRGAPRSFMNGPRRLSHIWKRRRALGQSAREHTRGYPTRCLLERNPFPDALGVPPPPPDRPRFSSDVAGSASPRARPNSHTVIRQRGWIITTFRPRFMAFNITPHSKFNHTFARPFAAHKSDIITALLDFIASHSRAFFSISIPFFGLWVGPQPLAQFQSLFFCASPLTGFCFFCFVLFGCCFFFFFCFLYSFGKFYFACAKNLIGSSPGLPNG